MDRVSESCNSGFSRRDGRNAFIGKIRTTGSCYCVHARAPPVMQSQHSSRVQCTRCTYPSNRPHGQVAIPASRHFSCKSDRFFLARKLNCPAAAHSVESRGWEGQVMTNSETPSVLVRFLDAFLQERNIKWVLGAGMLILLGSSVLLVTTHWESYDPLWKHLFLLGYAAAIHGCGQWSYHRLGLRR